MDDLSALIHAVAVYLDTNVLVQRSGLDSLELSTARALCTEAGIDIVVPAMVADEVESSRRRNIEAAFDALRAAHREASRYGPIAHLAELPTPGALARAHRDRLAATYGIAATPDFAPQEALRREAFCLRPARAGSGARDAAIWLTVREDHLRRAEDGYLVTNNSRDFAAAGDASTLHPSLADESCRPLPLALPTPVGPKPGSGARRGSRCTSERGRAQDARWLRSGGPPRLPRAGLYVALRPPPELSASEESRLFVASDMSTRVTALREARGYQIEDHRVTIGRVVFEAAFELGTLEKAGPGQVQKMIPVECSMTALVWFVEGAVGADPAVEISQVVATKVIAV